MESNLDKWLKDIQEKDLKVVTIICMDEDHNNHFYGWGSEEGTGPDQFIKQLRGLADTIEKGKGSKLINFIDIKLSEDVKLSKDGRIKRKKVVK